MRVLVKALVSHRTRQNCVAQATRCGRRVTGCGTKTSTMAVTCRCGSPPSTKTLRLVRSSP